MLSKNLLEEYLNCAICLHTMKDPTTTQCGHNYCYLCIMESGSNTCPICRSTFSLESLKINTQLKSYIEKIDSLESEENLSKIRLTKYSYNYNDNNTTSTKKLKVKEDPSFLTQIEYNNNNNMINNNQNFYQFNLQDNNSLNQMNMSNRNNEDFNNFTNEEQRNNYKNNMMYNQNGLLNDVNELNLYYSNYNYDNHYNYDNNSINYSNQNSSNNNNSNANDNNSNANSNTNNEIQNSFNNYNIYNSSEGLKSKYNKRRKRTEIQSENKINNRVFPISPLFCNHNDDIYGGLTNTNINKNNSNNDSSNNNTKFEDNNPLIVEKKLNTIMNFFTESEEMIQNFQESRFYNHRNGIINGKGNLDNSNGNVNGVGMNSLNNKQPNLPYSSDNISSKRKKLFSVFEG